MQKHIHTHIHIHTHRYSHTHTHLHRHSPSKPSLLCSSLRLSLAHTQAVVPMGSQQMAFVLLAFLLAWKPAMAWKPVMAFLAFTIEPVMAASFPWWQLSPGLGSTTGCTQMDGMKSWSLGSTKQLSLHLLQSQRWLFMWMRCPIW